MEYNVKINKVDTDNSEHSIYDASQECYEITLEEYRHVTERANKYDNKIYIMITFCSIFFAFIITLLDKLVLLPFPQSTKQNMLFIICTLLFTIICVCYIMAMVLLVLGLRPIKLQRFNPRILIDKSLWNKPPKCATMLAVKEYTEFILANNAKLEKSYKKLNVVTFLISAVVLLSFIEYVILTFL